LIDEIRACTLCPLCNDASPVPPQSLNPSKIMFVGDHPTRDDDVMGRPFSGLAGDVFRKLLCQAGIVDYHLTYSLKCFPGHVKPGVYQETCKAWLWREVKAVRPTVIVPLGMRPAKLLLKREAGKNLAKIAGKFFPSTFGPLITPWYSPEYVLNYGKTADALTLTFLKTVLERSCSKS
jgi:DNA polymerase